MARSKTEGRTRSEGHPLSHSLGLPAEDRAGWIADPAHKRTSQIVATAPSLWGGPRCNFCPFVAFFHTLREGGGEVHEKSLGVRHCRVSLARRRQNWPPSWATGVARDGRNGENGPNAGVWMYNRCWLGIQNGNPGRLRAAHRRMSDEPQ